MNKQQTIKELKKVAKKQEKSPGRREIPHNLYWQCLKHFKYYNEAKKAANLSMIKRTCNPFPESSKKLDKELARIVSYLTFDGHLDKKLRGCYFSSNKIEELEGFRKDIKKKFNIDLTKIEKGRGYGHKCSKYWYFNANLCKFLHSVGTPKGDKMLILFDIPDWIKNSKGFSKEYLKVAFLCEGSKHKVSKNCEKISFGLNKNEEIIEDGINFMNSIKTLLTNFNIETGKISIMKGNNRKDGKTTKMMRFHVSAKSNNNFINTIYHFPK